MPNAINGIDIIPIIGISPIIWSWVTSGEVNSHGNGSVDINHNDASSIMTFRLFFFRLSK